MVTQLSLFARNAAMARIESKAERVCPHFLERACAFVIDYLTRHGESSGEAITDACIAAGIKPHDQRAFGPVYMKLSRDHRIVKVGVCVRSKGHGTAGGNIWKLA